MAGLQGRIVAELRRQIASGELKPGDFLPTERQLGDQFGVARNTVRGATAALVNSGLVERVPGAKGGMRVRMKVVLTHYASRAELPDSPLSESDTFFREVREQGFTPSQTGSVSIVELTAEIAHRLEVDEGEPAALRRWIRSVNDIPTSIQATYYPRWLTDVVPELLSPRDIVIGTTQLLAQRGYEQVAHIDEEMSRMPTPEEIADMRLPPAGAPVLEHIRIGLTRERAVRVTVHALAGDSNRVVTTHGDPAALRRALESEQ